MPDQAWAGNIKVLKLFYFHFGTVTRPDTSKLKLICYFLSELF